MIPRDAIHARARKTRAAEDVAATDHHRHFHAERQDFLNLECNALDDRRIDAVFAAAHQRLARELHEDALVTD